MNYFDEKINIGNALFLVDKTEGIAKKKIKLLFVMYIIKNFVQ